MEKKRCQVCDGPVVNGRCKLCGMPYRNDETLYHLNENRSDHYRHATSRARAIMRQEEIPLGDKKAGSAAYKTGTGTGVAGAGNKYDQKTGTGSSKSLAGAGTGNFYNKGSVKAGSTYGGSTALLRMEIRSLSLLGIIIPRADKVQLELTALQLKKTVFTPRNR